MLLAFLSQRCFALRQKSRYCPTTPPYPFPLFLVIPEEIPGFYYSVSFSVLDNSRPNICEFFGTIKAKFSPKAGFLGPS
jgi:hypothetical protein